MGPQVNNNFGLMVRGMAVGQTEASRKAFEAGKAASNQATIKMASGKPDEIKTTHELTVRANEYNLESQGFPPALAKFMNQGKEYMPPKPGTLALVQNNFRSVINPKEEPKRTESAYYLPGGEAEQEEAVA